MEVPIVKIGNSNGLRLRKTILKKYNITSKVELILEEDHIILRPIHSLGEKWEDEFKKMREVGDDTLLIDDFFNKEKRD